MAPLTNHLLASLSTDLQHSILSAAIPVILPVRTLLEDETTKPEYGYFLEQGMASVVVNSSEGDTAEVALIGCEGLTGAYSLLGPALSSTRCFVQIPGSGYRVPFKLLRSLFLSSEEFRGAVLRFVQQQAVTTGQLVGCARLHLIEERLARWLLMVQDRIGGEDIRVTHEFMAGMLAVHRPTVTVALGALARAGLIENHRGSPRIIDRDRLVEAACACYPITRRLLKGLYPLKLGVGPATDVERYMENAVNAAAGRAAAAAGEEK